MKNKIDSFDLVSFFNGLVFFAPVALLIRTQAGVSESAFFLLQALLSIVIFLVEIPAGFLTDKIGYKRSLVLSQVLLLCARALLTVAFLTQSIVLFVVEVFVEGISTCFASGTDSAYLYEVYGEDNYLTKTSHSANFGTAGFIISTLGYAGIYKLFGIEALLYSTIVMGIFATIFSLLLKPDIKQNKEDEEDSATNSSVHMVLNIFKNKKSSTYVGMLSLFSIVWILINFFYVEKLLAFKLDVEWMSVMILVYSAIQMLAEPLLEKCKNINKIKLLVLTSVFDGILIILLGWINLVYVALPLMVIIPLCISIPEYLLMERENKLVDELGQNENRAASLSSLNMGVNVIEIVALFASATLTNIGIGWCFAIAGVLLILFAGIFRHVNRE